MGSSMTSTAIKKKLDSLAGSTCGLSTDSGRESARRKSLRRWINNLKCGVLWKQFLNYRIDQHGELSSTIYTLKKTCDTGKRTALNQRVEKLLFIPVCR